MSYYLIIVSDKFINRTSTEDTNVGEVIKFKIPKAKDKHQGKTLCKSGFHKWQIVQEKQFDVKLGKLVTVYRCSRCGEMKTKAL